MQQRIVKWDYRPFIETQCDAINKADECNTDELANKGIILHAAKIYSKKMELLMDNIQQMPCFCKYYGRAV